MMGRTSIQTNGFAVLAFLLSAFPVQAEQPCLSVSFTQTNDVFCLEVADTYASRETGLKNRSNLPNQGGIIFVFPENAPRVFWMKDTLLELDFLFLDDNGVVQNMVTHVQPGAIKIYGIAQYVIELPGGVGEDMGLWPGDKVLFSREKLHPSE
ncbi:MAG: DUF192 domain-containing protein [Kiritimatiellia bacterium]